MMIINDVPNKLFGQLLNFLLKNFIFLFIFIFFTSDVSYIEVWFTDQNSNVLDIEDKKTLL